MADEETENDSGEVFDFEATTDDVRVQEEEIKETRELANQNRALDFLTRHHPEIRLDYIEEVVTKLPLGAYPPDSGIDKQHKSVPYLTPYEKTKIIGFRANQLAKGAHLLITLEPNQKHITDVLELARMELEQRRLPFILKRPMPDGSFEYWRLKDLLIL